MALLLSIVIPAYNERERIGRSLDDVLRFLSSQPYRAEVIVVDDGSSDGTAAVVVARIEDYRRSGEELRLLTNNPNRGKGYSIKRGISEAAGDIVLFSDADFSSPITEAPKLIDPIIEGCADVTFGSRALDRSLIGVRQPLLRDFGGRVFNLLMKTVTGLRFKDTQCGFKAFRRDSALPVFRLQRIERFGFDPEVLYIARKRGLKLLEVPVAWNDSEGSKVSYLRDSPKMFLDLLMIRLNDLRGRYDDAAAARDPEPDAASSRASQREAASKIVD
ncbi:MAG TPA: dolichyl-phosphate beta-glucosyltransferase [Blastocatellia bacterium]|nr:dolichyl-phosphate beta-glucosyltransferase [Blastocatellia bacterium]